MFPLRIFLFGMSVERWRIALRRSARVQNKMKRRHKRKGGSAFSTEYLTFPWRRTRPRKQGTWEEWPGSDGRRWPGARGLSCLVEWDGDFERHQPGHFILKLQKTREKRMFPKKKFKSHLKNWGVRLAAVISTGPVGSGIERSDAL